MTVTSYAKAIAGAITAIVVYVVAQIGLDLPNEIVAALEVLVTGLVVYAVPNKPYVNTGGETTTP